MRIGIILLMLLTNAPVFAADITFYTHNALGKVRFDDQGLMRGKEHGGRRAFYIELVREMMAIVDHQPRTIHNVPFKRGLHLVQQQDNIAFFSIGRHPDRQVDAKYVGPLQSTAVHLFQAARDLNKITSLHQARRVPSICVLNGSFHDQLLTARGFNNLLRNITYESCLRMLIMGRVSLAVIPYISLPEALTTADINPERVNDTGIELVSLDSYIIMSTNISNSDIQRWQDALNLLRQNGGYRRLYDRFYRLPTPTLP